MVNDDTWSDKFSVSDNPVRNLMVRNAKIAPHVSNNNFVTKHPPLSGLVKVLIQVSVKAKSIKSNFAVELQIVEAVFKGRILAKLSICSLIHRCLPPRRIHASP